MIPALSTTGALWYTCLKPSPCLPDLNAFGWEQKNKCVGNRRTPHIQRKSQHFLFSFPLLSPGCFPALPTSLPLCLAFPLSRNPVIFASSMFVHFCGFREIRCFQCTVYGSQEHSKIWAYLGIWVHVGAYKFELLIRYSVCKIIPESNFLKWHFYDSIWLQRRFGWEKLWKNETITKGSLVSECGAVRERHLQEARHRITWFWTSFFLYFFLFH